METETRVSKFNSSIAILQRIDQLWKDAHSHSRSGQLMKWNWDLDRVWCELAADAEDKTAKFEEFNKNIKELIDKTKSEKTAIKYSKLYALILKKEIFLRVLQNKQGKGTVYEDSLEDYMDG